MGNALPDPGARGAAGETPTARMVSRCCVEKKEPGKADGRAADRQAPADHHSRRRQPGDRQSEAATVNAVSTIMLLMGLEARSASRAVYPDKATIRVSWTMHGIITPGRCNDGPLHPGAAPRCILIPVCCPYLDPIERGCGL